MKAIAKKKLIKMLEDTIRASFLRLEANNSASEFIIIIFQKKDKNNAIVLCTNRKTDIAEIIDECGVEAIAGACRVSLTGDNFSCSFMDGGFNYNHALYKYNRETSDIEATIGLKKWKGMRESIKDGIYDYYLKDVLMMFSIELNKRRQS